MFYQKLGELLRRMSSACRRDTISHRLSTSQRVGLEKHLRDEKAGTCKPTSLELCQSECKSGTGIYRASRTGGYYAKVFVYSLGLQGCARKELADAVNDHIGLIKVIDQLKRGYFEVDVSERMEPSRLDADLPPGLVASVQVFFYNRHFIGHRHLQLNFKSLTQGLAAWDVMQKAKGPTLFTGNGVTNAYTPEAAMKQWQRVKEAYLHYASGRRSSRAHIEEQLLTWEREQLPIRIQRECKLWQRQQEQTVKACRPLDNETHDSGLLRCVERLLRQHSRMSCSLELVTKPKCTRRKRMYHELLH